jgi:biopolymer transport protein ExbD/biopolymer transport protein TolR
MAFEVGPGRKRQPDINVTPLVDVVLVLLIIFLIVTPLLMREFWTHLPNQEKKEVEQKTPASDKKQLVLQILPDDKLRVNKVDLTLDELSERLKRMFAARDNHILFVDIKDEARYGFAVQAMDQARAGGAVTIAMLAKPLGKK